MILAVEITAKLFDKLYVTPINISKKLKNDWIHPKIDDINDSILHAVNFNFFWRSQTLFLYMRRAHIDRTILFTNLSNVFFLPS